MRMGTARAGERYPGIRKSWRSAPGETTDRNRNAERMSLSRYLNKETSEESTVRPCLASPLVLSISPFLVCRPWGCWTHFQVALWSWESPTAASPLPDHARRPEEDDTAASFSPRQQPETPPRYGEQGGMNNRQKRKTGTERIDVSNQDVALAAASGLTGGGFFSSGLSFFLLSCAFSSYLP